VIIFYDLYTKVGIKEAEFILAYSAIFINNIKDFYYENIINRNLEFLIVISLIRENFETLEY